MSRPSSELAHLFRALKAPAAARALPKLADRARQDEWSFEQFAAALLKTEVDSRDSHGGQGRIKAARFPARKTLEEFDFAFQTSIRRDTVLHLGQLDFLHGRENIVLLGPHRARRAHQALPLLAQRLPRARRGVERHPPRDRRRPRRRRRPAGGLRPVRPALQEGVFAPDYAPEEIAEIARKLRTAAGLSDEPTGIVAHDTNGVMGKIKQAVS